jgi:predicted AlkP superfamily phosphohydrolase/phosphomutase
LAIIRGSKLRKQRVLVLGIDGVPFSLMKGFIGDDLLPNFKTILSQGSLKRMNSVLPCVSSVAWASYMTGMNPAKHNIFGFIDRVPQTMEMFVPTSSHMAAETLWEWLSQNGKKVLVVNVPGTYPPRVVNGILIAVDWDFFQLHIMETDRINHFLLRQWKKGDPVYGPLFLKFYQKLDGYLGALIERSTDETELIILSDHGFCELKQEVYLNHWLEQGGFLKMKKKSDSVRDIHPESWAYSLFPGRIYVNLKGREATGRVEEGQAYEMTRQNLTEGLLGIRDPERGEPIIRTVLKREEVYKGPYLPSAPDLVAIPNEGYDLKGNFTKSTLTARGEVEGMHTYDDALLFVRNREIQKEDNEFGIMDSYSVVPRLMGLKRPEGVDAADLI